MTLSSEIKEAIEKNLPALVGSELKGILQHYESQKGQIEKLTEDNIRLKVIEKEHAVLSNNDVQVKNKQHELSNLQTVLQHKEELLKLREELLMARLNDMKMLVQTVFQSNRIGYNVNMNKLETELGTPQNNWQSKTTTSTVNGMITENI